MYKYRIASMYDIKHSASYTAMTQYRQWTNNYTGWEIDVNNRVKAGFAEKVITVMHIKWHFTFKYYNYYNITQILIYICNITNITIITAGVGASYDPLTHSRHNGEVYMQSKYIHEIKSDGESHVCKTRAMKNGHWTNNEQPHGWVYKQTTIMIIDLLTNYIHARGPYNALWRMTLWHSTMVSK